ncbi:linear gramicidin synthase subunit D [mine drainage metagenome]|uniref:Linear gramicidin synthase subunit D n=1 Tax=mine drainage metagenome TaxID=410659 RepID=A0A1J5R398_9ZZZZ
MQTYAGDRVAVSLGADLSRALKASAQRHGVTLHMLLLAAWAVLLARLSGQADVVIGTPLANRPRRELEGLIGFFVNTLPLRVQPPASASVATLLAEVRGTTLAAYAHQDLPFDQIVEAVQPPRSLSHAPVFQVLFSLNNSPAGEASLPGLRASALEVPTHSTQFDLAMGLQEAGEDIAGSLDYATDLFDADTARRWMGLWRQLLSSLARADAHTPVADLAWMSAADRALVLDAFNTTPSDRPHTSSTDGRLIHELFEEQARLQPAACALTFGGEQVSYGELDHRANQLARRLRAQQRRDAPRRRRERQEQGQQQADRYPDRPAEREFSHDMAKESWSDSIIVRNPCSNCIHSRGL